MRKLTAIGKVRAALREANEALKISRAAVDYKNEQIKKLEIQLNEARRHLLPFGVGRDGASGEVSFRPLAVLSFNISSQPVEVYSHHFGREMIPGHKRAELTVLAEMVDDPPVIYPTNTKKL